MKTMFLAVAVILISATISIRAQSETVKQVMHDNQTRQEVMDLYFNSSCCYE